MLFRVLQGEGLGGNALKSGDRKAAYRQDPVQHYAMLNIASLPDYVAVMNMPPGPAKELAVRRLKAEAELREQSVPEYWEDKLPRRNITQSSSWVHDVEYDPLSKILTINGYSTPGIEPWQAAEIVNAPSIGAATNNLWRRLKGK